eukprot:SAG31_NODE_1930_length_6881_cov_6.976998_7_plen_275_part_00
MNQSDEILSLSTGRPVVPAMPTNESPEPSGTNADKDAAAKSEHGYAFDGVVMSVSGRIMCSVCTKRAAALLCSDCHIFLCDSLCTPDACNALHHALESLKGADILTEQDHAALAVAPKHKSHRRVKSLPMQVQGSQPGKNRCFGSSASLDISLEEQMMAAWRKTLMGRLGKSTPPVGWREQYVRLLRRPAEKMAKAAASSATGGTLNDDDDGGGDDDVYDQCRKDDAFNGHVNAATAAGLFSEEISALPTAALANRTMPRSSHRRAASWSDFNF